MLVTAGTINGAFETILLDPTPQPDQTWTLYSSTDGRELRLRLDGPGISAAAPTPDRVTELALRAAPNPFNPRTIVHFDLPTAGPAQIDVVDLRGRRVARLVDAELPAGRHDVAFTGRDGNGQSLPSGIYFVQLRSAAGNMTRKVTLLQ